MSNPSILIGPFGRKATRDVDAVVPTSLKEKLAPRGGGGKQSDFGVRVGTGALGRRGCHLRARPPGGESLRRTVGAVPGHNHRAGELPEQRQVLDKQPVRARLPIEILRYLGGFAPDGPTTHKESEFYAGAYTKAHDALCQYKDPAEWED